MGIDIQQWGVTQNWHYVNMMQIIFEIARFQFNDCLNIFLMETSLSLLRNLGFLSVFILIKYSDKR